MAEPADLSRWATAPAPLALPEVRAALDQIAAHIAWRKAESMQRGVVLRLDALTRLFQLSPCVRLEDTTQASI